MKELMAGILNHVDPNCGYSPVKQHETPVRKRKHWPEITTIINGFGGKEYGSISIYNVINNRNRYDPLSLKNSINAYIVEGVKEDKIKVITPKNGRVPAIFRSDVKIED